MKKSNMRFVCLNEAICPIIPQRLADQKAKIENIAEFETNKMIIYRKDFDKEFEELK